MLLDCAGVKSAAQLTRRSRRRAVSAALLSFARSDESGRSSAAAACESIICATTCCVHTLNCRNSCECKLALVGSSEGPPFTRQKLYIFLKGVTAHLIPRQWADNNNSGTALAAHRDAHLPSPCLAIPAQHKLQIEITANKHRCSILLRRCGFNGRVSLCSSLKWAVQLLLLDKVLPSTVVAQIETKQHRRARIEKIFGSDSFSRQNTVLPRPAPVPLLVDGPLFARCSLGLEKIFACEGSSVRCKIMFHA